VTELNWDAIGATAELLGALGVIGSLMYLAVQIRQNTRSVRASSYQSAVAIGVEVNRMVAGDAALASILRRGREDLASLDPDEETRFNALLGSQFRLYENVYYQRLAGTLEPAMWEGYRAILLRNTSRPGVRVWWSERRTLFRREFAELFDAELAKADDHAT
jgi:hypothetical protein